MLSISQQKTEETKTNHAKKILHYVIVSFGVHYRL